MELFFIKYFYRKSTNELSSAFDRIGYRRIVLLWIIKRKYPKIRNRELIIIFILFFILVAIFTASGIDLIKRFISFIQV